MSPTDFRMLAIERLHESKLNPRRSFDKEGLAELAASIKGKGVLQPIVVRPNATGFEIVCGSRRFRAAKLAALVEMPAIVRELTDQEVLEVAVIENLQREDVHPLEEAEGYEQLLKLPGYSAEDLAAKVGKSKAYIYARMKLCALGPDGRKAFYAGKLSASVALLIARIPGDALQKEAVKELTQHLEAGAQAGFRSSSEHLQRRYMLRLKEAPFDLKHLYFRASTAEPIGPACGECPKRTGNQPELFADVQGADVCTDPQCFGDKKLAHFAGVRTKAEAMGQKIISGAAAKKLAPHDHLVYMNGVRKSDERCYDDSKNRTFAQLAKQVGVAPQLLELPESKEIVEVFDEPALKTALVKAGILKKGAAASPGGGTDADKKRKAKAKLEAVIRARILEAVRGRIAATEQVTREDGVMVATEFWESSGFEARKYLVHLYGWDAKPEPEAATKGRRADDWEEIAKAKERIAAMDAGALWRLMIDLALVGDVQVNPYHVSDAPDALNAAAERHGVDHAQIRSEILGDAKLKEAAKRASKKPVKKTPAATTV